MKINAQFPQLIGGNVKKIYDNFVRDGDEIPQLTPIFRFLSDKAVLEMEKSHKRATRRANMNLARFIDRD